MRRSDRKIHAQILQLMHHSNLFPTNTRSLKKVNNLQQMFVSTLKLKLTLLVTTFKDAT